MLKKILITLAGVFALLLIAGIVIPLVVDVDRYRPQLVHLANDRLNGKLALGNLKLSLWGKVRIEVAGLELSDAKGHKILSVKDAYFHLPLLSILSGSPQITFRMERPEVEVVKDASGMINLLTLAKPSQDKAAPLSSGGSVTLPAIALRARLGVELSDARIVYRDQASGLETQVRDLFVSLRDVSLSRPTELEIKAKLDTKLGKSLHVRGPVIATARAQVQVGTKGLEDLSARFRVDLDGLEITMPGLFHKKAGVAANAEGSLRSTPQEARIEQLDLRFHDTELRATGSLANLAGGSPVVQLSIKSNDIKLGSWAELVPMLAPYGLGGAVALEAEIKGPSERLSYAGQLSLKAMSFQAPRLKAKPRVDGVVRLATDRVESIELAMKAPGNELSLRGKVLALTSGKPRAELELSSSGMDLDQLIDWPPPAAASAVGNRGREEPPAGQGAPAAKTAGEAALYSDYDALLAPLRANAMARAMSAVMGVRLKSVKAYGVTLSAVQSKLALAQLVAGIEGLQFGLWDGQIQGGAQLDMKPARPAYRFQASVAGLDLKQAVSSQLGLFKNTVLGKADFRISGQGTSLNPPAAKAALDAKGTLSVTNAVFATVDVARMASESVSQAVQKLGDRIPALRGKKINAKLDRQSRYERISSSFSISGGRFQAPDFYAKAMERQGIDLKGNTTVGLVDLSLKADWEIIDTYNLTHAADLSVPGPAGIEVDRVLAEGGKPFRVPVSAGCTVSAPCYSYTLVPEFLGKVALANFSRATQGKAKSEALKRIEEKARTTSPAVQNAIKGLGKKLFGR